SYSLEAAQQARALHAYESALSWYTQASAYVLEGPEHLPERIALYEGLADMLFQQAHYSEAAAAYRAMREAAASAEDGAAQARAWSGLSEVQIKQSDYAAALESAHAAELVAEGAGVSAQVELLNALYQQGWVVMRKGNIEEAVRLGELALGQSRRLGARDMAAKSLKLLGTICVRVGHFKEATACFEQALALYRELEHQQGVGMLLNNLGVLAFKRGDYRTAVTRYIEALPLAQQIGSRDLEGLLLDNLGEAHVGLGEYRAAESELRRALQMAESAGRGEFVSVAYSYLAEAYLGQNRPIEAMEAAQEALLRGQTTGEPVHIGAAWRALGMVQAHPARIAAEVTEKGPGDCFAESVRLLQEIGADAEGARSLREWARYELEQGDRTRGKRLWREALALFVRLDMDQEIERMSALPARREP
ncbi:MAG: tetratricopeptide repeat protein, partial [Ardenticatenales bacterium]|nr:tetratricopeptide repeat protein [Ardenticatenales bacterium]